MITLSGSCYIEEWKHTRNNRTRTTRCSHRRNQLTENCSSVPKESAEEDSHTLRQIFDDTSDNVIFFVIAIIYRFYYMQFPLHALSCTCPFSEHFTLRSHYTPFTVLLLLHVVSFTRAFHLISITRLIHYTPFPLPALSAFPISTQPAGIYS